MTLYMFRTVFLSIKRSSTLYIQQQAFVKQMLCLPASRYEIELQEQAYVKQILLSAC